MTWTRFPKGTRCQVDRAGHSPFRAVVLSVRGDTRKVREIENKNTRSGRAVPVRFRPGSVEITVNVSQCTLEGRATAQGPTYTEMSQYPDPVLMPEGSKQ